MLCSWREEQGRLSAAYDCRLQTDTAAARTLQQSVSLTPATSALPRCHARVHAHPPPTRSTPCPDVHASPVTLTHPRDTIPFRPATAHSLPHLNTRLTHHPSLHIPSSSIPHSLSTRYVDSLLAPDAAGGDAGDADHAFRCQIRLRPPCPEAVVPSLSSLLLLLLPRRPAVHRRRRRTRMEHVRLVRRRLHSLTCRQPALVVHRTHAHTIPHYTSPIHCRTLPHSPTTPLAPPPPTHPPCPPPLPFPAGTSTPATSPSCARS